MDNTLHSILCQSGQNRYGLNNCAEAGALLAEHFSNKRHCLLEEWAVLRLVIIKAELAKVRDADHQQFILIALRVVEHSKGRFASGEWVRSSRCCKWDGGLFEPEIRCMH
ncbi:hypothetical protein [Pseudomonas sp. Kh13]|uniref:DUF6957 family protein n=1 Tax=Pseudomonas sp. Kh13 TaxID=2093744 RepID=UPI001181DE64|nr:hypothetical protein [Pseudomonas sp. Kh13]